MVYDESIELFLDCWRRVFSLKTLGGGYVRYFLLFTQSSLIKVETSHVGSSPPGSGFVLHDTLGRGDPASHIFWGSIFIILEKILKSRAEKEKDAIRRAGGMPTVREFIDSLDELTII